MTLWTDYPIQELGDVPNKKAPIRECTLVSYDRDKYCVIEVEGIEVSIKRGYIYRKPGRSGEVTQLSHSAACRIMRRNKGSRELCNSIIESLSSVKDWINGEGEMRVTLPGKSPQMMTRQRYEDAKNNV